MRPSSVRRFRQIDRIEYERRRRIRQQRLVRNAHITCAFIFVGAVVFLLVRYM